MFERACGCASSVCVCMAGSGTWDAMVGRGRVLVQPRYGRLAESIEHRALGSIAFLTMAPMIIGRRGEHACIMEDVRAGIGAL